MTRRNFFAGLAALMVTPWRAIENAPILPPWLKDRRMFCDVPRPMNAEGQKAYLRWMISRHPRHIPIARGSSGRV